MSSTQQGNLLCFFYSQFVIHEAKFWDVIIKFFVERSDSTKND